MRPSLASFPCLQASGGVNALLARIHNFLHPLALVGRGLLFFWAMLIGLHLSALGRTGEGEGVTFPKSTAPPRTKTVDDGTTFQGVVTNGVGLTKSNISKQKVTSRPFITTQPTSLIVNAGQSAAFDVTASGIPPLSYRWRKNGTAISGATSATYSIASAAPGDGGSYDVVVRDAVRNASTSLAATLTITILPPVITVSVTPPTISLQSGQTVTFTAAVTGTTNPEVIWSVTGGSITGAGVFTAPGIAGTYYVLATSVVDATISSQVEVIVSANRAPLALTDVRYWGYQIQDLDAPGAIDALAVSQYDMLVIEPTQTDASNLDFDAPGMVQRLKGTLAHDGVHRKRVLAYLDIGEAESWRWYRSWSNTRWTRAQWRRGVPRPADWPSFIIYPDPDGWTDCFPVAYWDPRWKAIVMGGIAEAGPAGAHGLIDHAIRAGFDGIYLDWVEVFEDQEVQKAALLEGLDPAVEMIRFISEMKAYARQRDPDFVVIQQNASELALGHPELYAVIDGLAQEGIWYQNAADVDWNDPLGYDQAQDPDYTAELLPRLANYLAAGVPVFSVDYALAHAVEVYTNGKFFGFIPYCTRSSLGRLTTTPPPDY